MKAPVSLTSFRPQKSLAIAIGVLARGCAAISLVLHR